jgi:hypothetical protein
MVVAFHARAPVQPRTWSASAVSSATGALGALFQAKTARCLFANDYTLKVIYKTQQAQDRLATVGGRAVS